VSWSVIAMTSNPASAAWPISSWGVSDPSDEEVWVWRSIRSVDTLPC
jgi:hypothetical protein